jgi:hypothetical protein
MLFSWDHIQAHRRRPSPGDDECQRASTIAASYVREAVDKKNMTEDQRRAEDEDLLARGERSS